jgi:hypothetical protein
MLTLPSSWNFDRSSQITRRAGCAATDVIEPL